MSTVTKPTVDTDESTRHDYALLHIYPGCGWGGPVPRPGDKALCGWVRRSTDDRSYSLSEAGPDACAVCCALWAPFA